MASNRPLEQSFFERAWAADGKGDWPAGLADEMRRQVSERDDALNRRVLKCLVAHHPNAHLARLFDVGVVLTERIEVDAARLRDRVLERNYINNLLAGIENELNS